MRSTWGHLRAPAHKPYRGFILFTKGEYRDVAVIQERFRHADGSEVQGSPWYFEQIHDFVERQTRRRKHGVVLRFEGTYTMLKNGKARFSGKVKTVVRAARGAV